MNGDLFKEKSVTQRVLSFLKGEQAEKGLELEESQKKALWSIRDLLLGVQAVPTVKQNYGWNSIVTVEGQYLKMFTPLRDKQVGLYGLIVSFKGEGNITFRTESPMLTFINPLYFAERGGIAFNFNPPIECGVNKEVWHYAKSEAGNVLYTVFAQAIVNMEGKV